MPKCSLVRPSRRGSGRTVTQASGYRYDPMTLVRRKTSRIPRSTWTYRRSCWKTLGSAGPMSDHPPVGERGHLGEVRAEQRLVGGRNLERGRGGVPEGGRVGAVERGVRIAYGADEQLAGLVGLLVVNQHPEPPQRYPELGSPRAEQFE